MCACGRAGRGVGRRFCCWAPCCCRCVCCWSCGTVCWRAGWQTSEACWLSWRCWRCGSAFCGIPGSWTPRCGPGHEQGARDEGLAATFDCGRHRTGGLGNELWAVVCGVRGAPGAGQHWSVSGGEFCGGRRPESGSCGEFPGPLSRGEIYLRPASGCARTLDWISDVVDCSGYRLRPGEFFGKMEGTACGRASFGSGGFPAGGAVADNEPWASAAGDRDRRIGIDDRWDGGDDDWGGDAFARRGLNSLCLAGAEFAQAGFVRFWVVEILENRAAAQVQDANAFGESIDHFARGHGGKELGANGGGDDDGVAVGAVVAGHDDFLWRRAGAEGTDKECDSPLAQQGQVDRVDQKSGVLWDVAQSGL